MNHTDTDDFCRQCCFFFRFYSDHKNFTMVIIRDLCEQCKKIQRPNSSTFSKISKAQVVMLKAAKEGHLNCVKTCLTAGANVNQLVPVDRDSNVSRRWNLKRDRESVQMGSYSLDESC